MAHWFLTCSMMLCSVLNNLLFSRSISRFLNIFRCPNGFPIRLRLNGNHSALYFFANILLHTGHSRSMLATIALGAAQSPWDVASGAIGGHLLATSIAILGGALLANYISEKLVGYLGGGLFLIFAVATFLGVF